MQTHVAINTLTGAILGGMVGLILGLVVAAFAGPGSTALPDALPAIASLVTGGIGAAGGFVLSR